MKLKDIHFIELLPVFMRDDPAVQGLAKSVDELIQAWSAFGKELSLWTDIDNLSEADLDEIAYEENLAWYENSAPLETKRELIRKSGEIKSQLGTAWAVEQVISAYFGRGYVKEWFEYGGQPGYFKIISSNPTITDENLDKFLRVLKKVKRASAHLDGIYIGLTGFSTLHQGVSVREVERVAFRTRSGDEIESWETEARSGVAVSETTKTVVLNKEV